MALKPWFRVVKPRDDLRSDQPLEASEFAVHLDHVRDGRAPEDYKNPKRFFAQTFMTENLKKFSAEVVGRLSGDIKNNAIFNLSTQFGGGKTHALTLLYHLVTNGKKANDWAGVRMILSSSGVHSVPDASVATFIGTEFDSIAGRGEKGEPKRYTPWGEIAYQLAGDEGFELVKEHDEKRVAPAGDVLAALIPEDKPTIILIDELMNYISRSRVLKLSDQTYNFIQNLSETIRSRKNAAIVVSIPASELEMTAADHEDFERIKKVLDRLGKPVLLSTEEEMSELIRRRLFQWDQKDIGADGRIKLDKNAKDVCQAYSKWTSKNKDQLPGEFPSNKAQQSFEACYPFHPSIFSVFENKWQTIPRFQRTRGTLRMLALWVSHAFNESRIGKSKDLMIDLGSAPLRNSFFRTTVFEQLGEEKLEGAVTCDIGGKNDAIAYRLDNEAEDTIKKFQLNQRTATIVFFHSNGGQTKTLASIPEIRLALSHPEFDIANTETMLENLDVNCHYFMVEGGKYRFSMTPNLNKVLSDTKSSIKDKTIDEYLERQVKKIFKGYPGIGLVQFPEKSSDIRDEASLQIVVLSPDYTRDDPEAISKISEMTVNIGNRSRRFKSGLLWVIAESSTSLKSEIRNLLAYREISQDEENRLDDNQRRQCEQGIMRSQSRIKESIWRAYRYVFLLDKDGRTMREIDLGLMTASSSDSIIKFILARLQSDDEVTNSISAEFLNRKWNPSIDEWNIKDIRDTFFASPKFPRLLDRGCITKTISSGIYEKLFALVGPKNNEGHYEPFHFGKRISDNKIDFGAEMCLIRRDVAEIYEDALKSGEPMPEVIETVPEEEIEQETFDVDEVKLVQGISWNGDVSDKQWMNFYTKVLAKFSSFGHARDLKINVDFEVNSDKGIAKTKADEVKVALRELGLDDNIKVRKKKD